MVEYTDEERELAAQALCQLASWWALHIDKDLDEDCPEDIPLLQDILDIGTAEYTLASDAAVAVPIEYSEGAIPFAYQYGEAEAWVRSGWTDFGDWGWSPYED